jgi:hypothetical protein
MTQIGDRNWNPLVALARALPGTEQPNEAQSRALEMHKAQYAAHQYGMELESHKAGLAEEAAQAQHGRNMEFFGSVLRHAKHETPIHLSIGDVTAQFTKKPKATRAPKTDEPSKTPKPLPVRDPKTGRAMKAPQ